MKLSNKVTKTGLLVAAIAFSLSVLAMGSAAAQSASDTTTTPSTSTAASGTGGSGGSTARQQTELSNIINKGNEEIARRLTSLNALDSKITATKNLSNTDLTFLENEVTAEISGLASLKTALDNCATVTPVSSAVQCAVINARDIIGDYRVYALILPKVQLVKMADDQMAIEINLTTLGQKIQNRITNDLAAGKNVSSLQTELNTMIADINAAQALSTGVEQAVLPLLPSDYNTNRSVLSGYATKLQTAKVDLQSAAALAKTIISTLKTI